MARCTRLLGASKAGREAWAKTLSPGTDFAGETKKVLQDQGDCERRSQLERGLPHDMPRLCRPELSESRPGAVRRAMGAGARFALVGMLAAGSCSLRWSPEAPP